jgi:hypothetical protein
MRKAQVRFPSGSNRSGPAGKRLQRLALGVIMPSALAVNAATERGAVVCADGKREKHRLPRADKRRASI